MMANVYTNRTLPRRIAVLRNRLKVNRKTMIIYLEIIQENAFSIAGG